MKISGGKVKATGGRYAAGIGGGNRHTGGTITVSGGEVKAYGDQYGTGIGGGYWAHGHEVTISGGKVAAHGGENAPGIGNGYGNALKDGDPATVSISGGQVAAIGGAGAPGIGAGYWDPQCAVVNITGGTIVATGGGAVSGREEPDDIGFSGYSNYAKQFYALTIKGASVHATHRTASNECVEPAPSNGTERVWCVTVETQKTNELVRVEYLDGFGEGSEIYADQDGKIYLWLPNGTHIFFADTCLYKATVSNADTTVEKWFTGVTADGVDVAHGWDGEMNWYYDFGDKLLYVVGDCVISGTNTEGFVNILAMPLPDEGGGGSVDSSNVVFTISNLYLKATSNAKTPPISLTNGTVTVRLAGTNRLDATGTDGFAGINVASPATLIITNLEERAKLEAYSGKYAAGIGGNRSATVGTIVLSGGIIEATGGKEGGAGIGGGYAAKYGDGAKIAISGGTISARGGWYESGYHAADIGLGMDPDSGEENYSIVFSGSSTWMVNGCFDETGHVRSITPVNEANARVYKATITGFTPHAKVEIEISDYGTNDIYADSVGSIYLWLANGTYYVNANGSRYALRIVNGTATTIALPDAYGVKVDGIDVVNLSGDTWSYDPVANVLTLKGDCTLSGTNTYAPIKVYAYNNVTVAVGRLSLSARDEDSELFDGNTLTITNGTSTLLGRVACDLVIRGGSHVIYSSTIPSVSNGSDYVDPVILGGYVPNAPVEIEGPTDYYEGAPYGTSNIFADGSGRVYLWLPVGIFNIKINGIRYIMDVDFFGYYTLEKAPIGVEVDGTDVKELSGTGWTYDFDTRAATLSGTHAVSGTNTCGEVKICASGAATISPSRLVIEVGAGEEVLSGSGTVTIADGTAYLTGDVSCPVKLLGGSFRLNGTAAVAFSNETEAVHCVTVSNLTAGAEIAVGGLPAYYGTDGIYADENGKIYIWLPDGTHNFTAGGIPFRAVVDGAATQARELFHSGVFVGDDEVGIEIAGTGWSYDVLSARLTLTGDVTLSGTNTAGAVRCIVESAADITFSNLCLKATGSRQTPFAIASNVTANITFTGTNTFAAGKYCAAISVPYESRISIGGDGWLFASGGNGDGWSYPGIGASDGSYHGSTNVVVRSGNIVATTPEDFVDSITGALIAGGNVNMRDSNLAYNPDNESLYRVKIENLSPGEPVTLTGLPDYYDVSGIRADGSGKAYLWLAWGNYSFTANGTSYLAGVSGSATTAVMRDVEVFVNDANVCTLTGPGWYYDVSERTLWVTNQGSYTVTGTNTEGKVAIYLRAVDGPVNLTLKDLHLSGYTRDNYYSPIVLSDIWNQQPVTITLVSSNSLVSCNDPRNFHYAGIFVPQNRKLTINGDGYLYVKGNSGAAIGGLDDAGSYPHNESCGEIYIEGGIIDARGSSSAIGCCYSGSCGKVKISGGTVFALAGYGQALGEGGG